MNENQVLATRDNIKLPIEEKEEAKYPQFVLDVPSTKDDLGGPHERLAETLNQLLRNSTSGGSVCLRGPRGAGKTTTVQLLEQKLTSPDIFVFQFDSWAHEGVSLRTEFLATFISELADRGWLEDQEYWKTERDIVLGKLKITKNQIANGVTIQLVVLFFVSQFFSRLANPLESVYKWLVTPSLVLWCLELIALGIPILYLCKNAWWRTIWYFLKWNTLTEAREQKSPDVSSAVFEDHFWKIVNSASINRSRRLVIVLDNADRLAPNELEQMLSVLKILLTGQAAHSNRASSGLWFVVPWWADHFNQGAHSELVANEMPAKARKNEAIAPLNSHMIPDFDKYFQLRLDVPPCLTTPSWDYLLNLIEVAFGPKLFAENKAQFKQCCRIFQTKNIDSIWSFTPREAKQFVNYMVAGYLQWHDSSQKISLASIALFYFVGDSVRKSPSDILTATFPDEQLKGIASNLPWQNDFLTLLFLMEPGKSKHALLYRNIFDAISKGQPEDILCYSELDGVASLVCNAAEYYLDSYPEQAFALHRCIIALSTLEHILSTEKEENVEAMWKECRSYLVRLTNWYQLTEIVVPSILATIESAPTEEQMAISQSVLNSLTKNESEPDIASWLVGLELLVKSLIERNLLRQDTKLVLPGKGEVFEAIRRHGLSNLRRMGEPSITLSQVFLEAGIVNNVDSSYYRLLLGYTDKLALCDWSESLGAMEKWFTGGRIPESNCQCCLKILLLLFASDVPGSLALLRHLALTGKLEEWLRIYSDNAITTGAIVLAAILGKASETFVLQFHKGSETPEVKDKYLEMMEEIMKSSVTAAEAIEAAAHLAREINLLPYLQSEVMPPHLESFVREILSDRFVAPAASEP